MADFFKSLETALSKLKSHPAVQPRDDTNTVKSTDVRNRPHLAHEEYIWSKAA